MGFGMILFIPELGPSSSVDWVVTICSMVMNAYQVCFSSSRALNSKIGSG